MNKSNSGRRHHFGIWKLEIHISGELRSDARAWQDFQAFRLTQISKERAAEGWTELGRPQFFLSSSEPDEAGMIPCLIVYVGEKWE